MAATMCRRSSSQMNRKSSNKWSVNGSVTGRFIAERDKAPRKNFMIDLMNNTLIGKSPCRFARILAKCKKIKWLKGRNKQKTGRKNDNFHHRKFYARIETSNEKKSEIRKKNRELTQHSSVELSIIIQFVGALNTGLSWIIRSNFQNTFLASARRFRRATHT